MTDFIIALDKELFLFFNGLHTPWLDPVMVLLTNKRFWIPLYLFLLYHVLKEYKKESWIVLLGIGLMILLADQTNTSFMKPFFGRLRPSHEPDLQGLVHLVNGYKGGTYGFASSHASNSFGTATFFNLLLRNKKPWVRWLFLWAVLVSYTRIYLGVHYPADIVVGAAIGVLYAWLCFKLYKIVDDKRKTPSIP